MADLDTAKADILAQFKSALPPNMPAPAQFTIPELIARPVLTTGVIGNMAHDVIAGTYVPATSSDLATWSTADMFATTYQQMVMDMVYGLSQKDQNEITSLTTKNQVVLNNLVTIWEQTFSPITQEQMAAAGVHSKIDYVTAQFTPQFMQSLNWAKFAPDYNSAKADIQIMSNINSAKVEFANQITAIKANIQSPSQTNGGVQAFDRNNNKVWFPGYNVDPNFPAKFNTGQTVNISVSLTDVGQSGSSFSVKGGAGGAFDIGWLGISGASSAQYSESNFQKLMSSARIDLTYTNVAYLSASPANLMANNTIGWYLASILKQAYNNTSGDTGPYFGSNEASHKAVLAAGGLQSLRGFLLSTMPTGKMFFASDDFSSFQKYFHTESHASVSLFGILPIASASTSYTKSSSGSSDKNYAMEVDINPTGDKNNLVVHGAFLENPLD